jgi:hypothetical protein
MMNTPTADQERGLLLASRFGAQQAWFAQRTGGWCSVGWLTRVAFFMLGLVASMLVASIVGLLHAPQLMSALILIASAEWLIATHRLSNAGIEEALILSGLTALTFSLLDAIGGLHEVAAAVAATMVLALAGLRLRNPLFTTLAVIASTFAIALASDISLWTPSIRLGVSLYCYVVVLLALGFGAREYRRPSHDHMLDWLVVIMPVIGYFWSTQDSLFFAGVDYRYQLSLANLYVVLAPLILAALTLVVGLRRRSHAPLLAFMVCVACVAYELRALSGWSSQTRLIIWGGLTLIIAVSLDKWLATSRRGVTSSQLNNREGPLDLLQLVGVALATPHDQAASPPSMQGEGGQFGGGGASGRY